DMQPQIAHHADLAAEFVLPLPVDRLRRIEIARVEEARADFEQATERAGAGELEHALCTGEEGEFGRDAHESPEALRLVTHAPCRREIDPERFFGEQIFA